MGGSDPITWGAVIAFIGIVGAFAKIYLHFKTQVEASNEKTRKVETSLSDYKLTVSETYISKKDLHTSLAPLMDHVSMVKESVDKLGNRLDRMMETQIQHAAPTPRRARSST